MFLLLKGKDGLVLENCISLFNTYGVVGERGDLSVSNI